MFFFGQDNISGCIITLDEETLNFDEYKRQLKFKEFGIKSLKKADSNFI